MGVNIKGFLDSIGLNLTDEQLEKVRTDFVSEMNAGLKGEQSSLMMLPTYITADGVPPEGERIIVVDAGGTNLRVAVCRFTGGGIDIESFEKSRMPGSEQPIDVEDFFLEVAKRLMPVIDKSDKIGVCFSYAAKVLPNKDAEIIAMSKEVVLHNFTGALVCEGISRALVKLGVSKHKSFVLINDTVAALLGAKAEHNPDNFSEFTGFILGTGTNIAYSEKCAAITKQPDIAAKGGSMIINMESGYFDKLPRTEIDLKIDEDSRTPGKSIGEKMISGAYIGEISRLTLVKAGEASIISKEAFVKLAEADELPLWEVDKFLSGEESSLDSVFSPSDREPAAAIITAVFERAAGIVAAQFAGIYGRNSAAYSLPVCVCAEGTTINKSPIYKPLVEEAVKKQLGDRFGVKLEFVYVEDATLKGTALAAALNCE